MELINIQGIFAENGAYSPATARANCGSLLVMAWGEANADKVAAELNMSIDAAGLPMGIDAYMQQAKIDCARADQAGKSYGVIVSRPL